MVRLLRRELKEHMKQLAKGLPGFTQTALQLRGVASADALLDDAVACICDRAFIGDDDAPQPESLRRAEKARAYPPAGCHAGGDAIPDRD